MALTRSKARALAQQLRYDDEESAKAKDETTGSGVVKPEEDAPAGHGVLGGTRLHGVPAVTVPGHVPGVRASTLVPNRPFLVPNRPWRAEPPVWRYLLGTSATPQLSRILRQAPTCWRARYLGDGDVVSIAASSTSAYQAIAVINTTGDSLPL
ncbi:hypothetical protein MTO96_030365 [Rhipicephalus appendiculatus]